MAGVVSFMGHGFHFSWMSKGTAVGFRGDRMVSPCALRTESSGLLVLSLRSFSMVSPVFTYFISPASVATSAASVSFSQL